MKVAVIGVGHWGRNHLKIYMEMKEEGIINDIVIFDNNKSILNQVTNDFHVESYKSVREIIDDPEIQMVSIVTSSPSHFPLTKAFLEARKDVLVEKPLSLTSNECWELIELAKKLNRLLLPGHLFRYHNALIELKRLIQRGDLGDIIQILVERSSFRIPRKDMGVLYALAIHDVDITCFLLGEQYPLEICAYAKTYYQKYPDEIASIYQKFKNGTIAVSNESWLNPIDGKMRKVLVIGTRGSVKIDLLIPDTLKIVDSYIEIRNKDNFSIIAEGTRVKRVEQGEPLRNEIYDFVESSMTRKPPSVQMEIGARAVEMIEIAFESIEKKRMINVDEYLGKKL